MRLQRRGDSFERDFARVVFGHLKHMHILNREAVCAELEIASQRFEIGLTKRCPERRVMT